MKRDAGSRYIGCARPAEVATGIGTSLRFVGRVMGEEVATNPALDDNVPTRTKARGGSRGEEEKVRRESQDSSPVHRRHVGSCSARRHRPGLLRHPAGGLIEWNKYTLEHMHPIFCKRWERDGLGEESMWLGEDDIEPDTGEPAVIEQPANIATSPLEADDEDDRVRMVLGLTSNDPLADVDADTLLAYHRYLAAHLKFPFEASWTHESGPFSDATRTVTITGLVDPEDDPGFDETYGLFAEAKSKGRVADVPLSECEAKKGSPNRQLLKDYAYWFWNHR